MHERVHFLQVRRPILALDELESLVEVRESLTELVGLQQSDGEIVICSEFFLTWALVSRWCSAGFAQKLDCFFLVSLSLKHNSHVDIELGVWITMSVSLLQLGHHLHGFVSLPSLLEADCKVRARLEERGLRIRVWSILSSNILILIGLDLDHLLVWLIIEYQSILQIVSLIMNQGYIEICFRKLLGK